METVTKMSSGEFNELTFHVQIRTFICVFHHYLEPQFGHIHRGKFFFFLFFFCFCFRAYQPLKCLPKVRETWVQSQVKSYQRLNKWYLIPPCLTLSIIRYESRVKWSNPRKGVAPSPKHLGVVAIEKGAFGSPSRTVANFTYFTANCWGGDKVVHIFSKCICLKVNVIVGLEFELTTMSQSRTLATTPGR